MAKEEEKAPSMEAKEMIANHAKAGTKVRYQERINLEIITDTKHYSKGQLISPHKIMGERLIEQKIAKAVK